MYSRNSKRRAPADKVAKIPKEQLTQLTLNFSKQIPTDVFTPTQLQGYLLNHREAPVKAATSCTLANHCNFSPAREDESYYVSAETKVIYIKWGLAILGHVRPFARAKVSVHGIKVSMAPAGRRRWWRRKTLGRASAVRAHGVRRGGRLNLLTGPF